MNTQHSNATPKNEPQIGARSGFAHPLRCGGLNNLRGQFRECLEAEPPLMDRRFRLFPFDPQGAPPDCNQFLGAAAQN